MTVIFHCNHLLQNIGVPGVNQSMIANMHKYAVDGVKVIGCNYEDYFLFTWKKEGKEIEVEKLDITAIAPPSLVIFSGFDPYLKVLKNLLKWKIKGSAIGFWTWGFFTKQQSQNNWETGKKPRWLKWSAIKFKKITFDPLIDYFLVSSQDELDDSKLPVQKCVLMPMGRPQSAILDSFDNRSTPKVEFKEESLNYIGRGRWYAKGLADIVDYAHTDIGKKQTYRFFISSKDDDFDTQIEKHKAPNIEWYFDVFGANNLDWLYRSAAFIAPSRNPIQTRVAYEAIYTGTPLLVLREGYMDGFKKILTDNGILNGIQIISDKEFDDRTFTFAPVSHEEREKMSSLMQDVFSAKVYTEWLSSWFKQPTSPRSYYQDMSNQLKDTL